MTSTEPVELSLRGELRSAKSDLGKLAGKLGGLFNPALHPRGYHGRFVYTGGRDLRKAEAAARKAARHEGHLNRLAARHHSGGTHRTVVVSRGSRGRRGRRNINWPNNIPGHGGGLGRMLGGGKGTQPKGTQPKGAGAGKGQQPKGGKGTQPKGAGAGKGQQPKGGKGTQPKGGKGTQPKGSQQGQKAAAAQLKAARAAMAKAQKAAAAQQKAQAAAYAKQVKAILAALTKLATAAQKMQAAALKAQAQQMMAAAKPAKFTPSPNAPLYGGRRSAGRTISGNVGGNQLVLSRATELAADSMAKASTYEPVGPNDLWHKPGFKLPPYIEHVANDLIEKRGKDESSAVRMAVGIIKRWAAGSPTGGMRKIKPTTVAAARKALAEWEALKAKAKTVKSTKHFTAEISDDELILELTYPGGGTFPAADTFPVSGTSVGQVSSAGDGPRATTDTLARRRQVAPDMEPERPVEVITGRRYRRYLQQGYSPASALMRVAREAQERQARATELAHQPGSVLVSSANDGPRVTKASTSRPAGKAKRSWDTAANRKRWAKTGVALPDGSFPIPSAAFVGKAARALGRAPASKRARVRAHIRRRAKALGVTPPALGR